MIFRLKKGLAKFQRYPFSRFEQDLEDGMDELNFKAKILSDAKERKLMEKLEEMDMVKMQYEVEREKKLRAQFLGPEGVLASKEKEMKYQQFMDKNKNLKQKLEDYIREKDSYQRFDKLKQNLKSGNFPKYLKEMNVKNHYLDEYQKYDYYKEQYIEKIQNNKMRKEDEHKMDLRNENDQIKAAVNNFFKSLDQEYQPKKHFNPISVKAKILEKYKEKLNHETPKETGNIQKEIKEGLSLSPSTIGYKIAQAQAEQDEHNLNFTLEKQIDNLNDDDFEEEYEFDQYEDAYIHFIRELKREKENVLNNEHREIEQDYEENFFQEVQDVDSELNVLAEEINQTEFFLRTQFKIYDLYQKGWKINELSKKFGALPSRIKFIVWNVQHFFEEEIAYQPMNSICERLLDMDHNIRGDKVDFGVDAEQLATLKDKAIQVNFPGHSHEHVMKPNKQVNLSKEEIQKKLLQFKIKSDKYVDEGYDSMGLEATPYVIRSWIPQKTQKRDHVNAIFEEIVRRSHYPKSYFKLKVQKRLDQGPRIASKGYGLI